MAGRDDICYGLLWMIVATAGLLPANCVHAQITSDRTLPNNTTAYLASSTFSGGSAGNLTIQTDKLSARNGTRVFTNSQGSGRAGNLDVTANTILLDNKTQLSANTKADLGNINLNSRNLVLSRGSQITTNATGKNIIAGNINIDTDALAVIENSKISSDSIDFRGGKIEIDTQSIFDSHDSSITAKGVNSQLNGTVQINSPDIDPSRGLIILPTVTENPPKLVSSSCTAFNETAGGNNFTITGRGGLPPSPYEPLTSDAIWSDTRLPQTTAHQNQPNKHVAKIKPKPIEIVPATGWVFNDKGEVTLISSVSNTPSTPTSCPAR